MKKYLFIVLLVGVCYSQKSYNEKHLVEQNGIWCEKYSDEIVNGKVYKKFKRWLSTRTLPLGSIKNGKKEGKWIAWYDNGVKSSEKYYKEGNPVDKWIYYYEDGKVRKTKENFIDINNYFGNSYDKNGLLTISMIYKDDRMFQGEYALNGNKYIYMNNLK